MRTLILKDGNKTIAKFTVEEKTNGRFISTEWMPDHCLEVDREVCEFETYSAALAHMLDCALNVSLSNSSLRRLDK